MGLGLLSLNFPWLVDGVLEVLVEIVRLLVVDNGLGQLWTLADGVMK